VAAAPAPPGTTTPSPTGTASDDETIPWGTFGSLIPSLFSETTAVLDGKAAAEAINLLIKQCVEAKGFEYAGVGQQGLSYTDDDSIQFSTSDGLLGLVDLAAGRANGYQLTATMVDRQLASTRSLGTCPVSGCDDSEAYGRALTGESEGEGCYDQAYAEIELSQAWADARQTMQQIDDQVFAKASGDSAVREGIQAWSSCMAQRGYDYKDPAEASTADWENETEIAETPGGSAYRRASSRQIAVATADADCKEQTGLIETYRQAAWREQQRLIEANKPAVDAAMKLRDETSKKIAQIIADAE
jgi:hypothetical protein